ncbi:MAG: DUF5320 domain-containing protein [candidate division KSB1 bacterium]|nr:DUF5320 domain-containing protein [candidate division KSB1 bacterium]
MAKFDGKGPLGNGPLTGCGGGYCILKLDAETPPENHHVIQNKTKEVHMPAGDRTGPRGMGPMTGRGAGFCAGFSRPGYASPGAGRGIGMRGGGRGWRNRYVATGMTGWQRAGWGGGAVPPSAPYQPEPEDELESLQAQARSMQQNLEQINQRIQELENSNSSDEKSN